MLDHWLGLCYLVWTIRSLIVTVPFVLCAEGLSHLAMRQGKTLVAVPTLHILCGNHGIQHGLLDTLHHRLIEHVDMPQGTNWMVWISSSLAGP